MSDINEVSGVSELLNVSDELVKLVALRSPKDPRQRL